MALWTSRKWDGSLHRRAEVELIKVDELGRWVHIERGMTIEKPDGGDYLQPWEVLVLLPHEGWWHLSWMIGEPMNVGGGEGPDLVLYADVATGTELHGDQISSVDLDLDVARLADGTVTMLDLDEFNEHAAALAYPEWVTAAAMETWWWLEDQMTAETAPFTPSPPQWFGPAGAGTGQ